MPLGPSAAEWPGVAAGGRVAEAQRRLHLAEALDRPAEAAVADGHEPAVPVLVGSHSSALIFESAVGLSTSFTRQCAGSGGAAGALGPAGSRRGVAAGATNGPAGALAALMATCGVDIEWSDSHGVAAAAARTTRLETGKHASDLRY